MDLHPCQTGSRLIFEPGAKNRSHRQLADNSIRPHVIDFGIRGGRPWGFPVTSLWQQAGTRPLERTTAINFTDAQLVEAFRDKG
jgi:hypothetical protein